MASTVRKSIVDTPSDAAEPVIPPDAVGEWLLSLAIDQAAHTQSNDVEMT